MLCFVAFAWNTWILKSFDTGITTNFPPAGAGGSGAESSASSSEMATQAHQFVPAEMDKQDLA